MAAVTSAGDTERRSALSWALYVALGGFAYLLNGLGAVLGPLQRDLGVSRAAIAFYPTLLAGGLIGVGLVGGRLVGRLGRRRVLVFALAASGGGALLLVVPVRSISLTGAIVFGAAGALLVQLVPALLVSLHPRQGTAFVGEANALASVASVLAPLLVAAGLAGGLGWRPGYLVGAAAMPVLAVRISRTPADRIQPPGRPSQAGRSRAPRTYVHRWADVLLAVSVEFAMVLWVAAAFVEWHGVGLSAAAAMVSVFLVGMAAARVLASPVTARVADVGHVIVGSCVVAAVGFALFWTAGAAGSSAGLALAGLGTGLLYPATLTRAIAAWPTSPDTAAARAALASGLAIGGAPAILAWLSEAVGLRTAYLLVPALLMVLVAHIVMRGEAPQTPGPASTDQLT